MCQNKSARGSPPKKGGRLLTLSLWVTKGPLECHLVYAWPLSPSACLLHALSFPEHKVCLYTLSSLETLPITFTHQLQIMAEGWLSIPQSQAHCSPSQWARTTVRLLPLNHDVGLLCSWWLVSEMVNEDVTLVPTCVLTNVTRGEGF